MSNEAHILVVDDEPFNIEIVIELLDGQPYQISSAEDGAIAWSMLEKTPDKFDVVLLDRMMPNMNGMEVLEKMQANEVLKHCPVIFQTAKASNSDIAEGLKAGAHYYITKPFNEDVLLSVIKTAVRERLLYKELQDRLGATKEVMGLMKTAHFAFQTLDQARSLATLISNACPQPEKVVMGITELMLNAVEHGNLGITYNEKSVLNGEGTWSEEVAKRLLQQENIDKYASIQFQLTNDVIEMIIKDEGDGFDWQTYMDFDPERVMDNHGRGIAIANTLSFDSLEYSGNGNEVTVRLAIE